MPSGYFLPISVLEWIKVEGSAFKHFLATMQAVANVISLALVPHGGGVGGQKTGRGDQGHIWL